MSRVPEIAMNSEVMAFLAERKEQDLTGDDMAQVLEMCVSERTCEAREEKHILLIETAMDTMVKMNARMDALGIVVGQNTTGVAVIKDAHVNEAMSFKRKMALAMLIVVAVGVLSTYAVALVKPLFFK